MLTGSSGSLGLMTQSARAATVLIIDDDPNMRAAIAGLVKSVGLGSEVFASAQEFLGCRLPEGPSCLVLDVKLPGMNGLDVQRELAAAGVSTPIIFITGFGDIPMTVKAMKSGAPEFHEAARRSDLLDDFMRRSTSHSTGGRAVDPQAARDAHGPRAQWRGSRSQPAQQTVAAKLGSEHRQDPTR